MSRAFILCAGSASRWNNYLGVPKQLAPVEGQPLLSRTVQILRTLGVNDIQIVTHDARLHQPGCGIVRPEKSEKTMETFLSTQPWWKERNIVLLGDIWFSESAMRQIISSKGELHFFGRPNFSRFTGCLRPEMFGFAFSQNVAYRMRNAAEESLVDLSHGTTPGKLWAAYYRVMGPPWRMWLTDRSVFQTIDDFTNDFDTPGDYLSWNKNRALASSSKPWHKARCYTALWLTTPIYHLTIPRRRIHPLWLLVDAILQIQARRRANARASIKPSSAHGKSEKQP